MLFKYNIYFYTNSFLGKYSCSKDIYSLIQWGNWKNYVIQIILLSLVSLLHLLLFKSIFFAFSLRVNQNWRLYASWFMHELLQNFTVVMTFFSSSCIKYLLFPVIPEVTIKTTLNIIVYFYSISGFVMLIRCFSNFSKKKNYHRLLILLFQIPWDIRKWFLQKS